MPAGYETTVDGDDMRIDSDGPRETLTAKPAQPDTFYAILSAENRAAYTSTRISLAGGIEVVLLRLARGPSLGGDGRRHAPDRAAGARRADRARLAGRPRPRGPASASRPRSRATPACSSPSANGSSSARTSIR